MPRSTESSCRRIEPRIRRGSARPRGRRKRPSNQGTAVSFLTERGMVLCARSRSGALPHALRDNPDLLNARTLGRVDDVDDVAIPQRTVAADEHRLVLAVLEAGAKPLFELGELDVLVICRDFFVRSGRCCVGYGR